VPLFRDVVRQVVLGDDTVSTTSVSWYNQRVVQVIAREFGAKITSSRKDDVLTEFDDPAEVTFLKRRFVWRDGQCLAPIELKTLIKMLLWRSSGPLSLVDHEAMMMSNVLAESWMLGREVFDRFHGLITAFLRDNPRVSPHLVILTYDEYVERYASKNNPLCLWDPLQNNLL
jgi:hypothetical protein